MAYYILVVGCIKFQGRIWSYRISPNLGLVFLAVFVKPVL